MKQLPAIVIKKAKRVGRGYGSGKGGHTSGRGTKGQKSRGDIPIMFEGTKTKKSLIKRTPFLRGRGKLKPLSAENKIVNLKDLTDWPKNQPISEKTLIEAGAAKPGDKIKILGEGEATTKMKFTGLPMSKTARDKVIAAGGQVE